MAAKTTKEVKKSHRSNERQKIYQLGFEFEVETKDKDTGEIKKKKISKKQGFQRMVSDLDLFGTIVSLKECIEDFKKLSEQPKELVDTFTTELSVHMEKLNSQAANLMDTLEEAVYQAARNVPSNIYNVKEALDNFAQGIRTCLTDSDSKAAALISTENFIKACQDLPRDINRSVGALERLYTQESLDVVKQQGFEAGYDKGVSSVATTSFGRDDLDL